MTPQYIPYHTLRRVCQMCSLPQARLQIPVALTSPVRLAGGKIVMLERNTD